MKSLLLMIVLLACALVAPAAATDCVGRFDRGLSRREARLLRQLERERDLDRQLARERDFERELDRLRFRRDTHRPRFFFSF